MKKANSSWATEALAEVRITGQAILGAATVIRQMNIFFQGMLRNLSRQKALRRKKWRDEIDLMQVKAQSLFRIIIKQIVAVTT